MYFSINAKFSTISYHATFQPEVRFYGLVIKQTDLQRKILSGQQ